MFMSVCIFACMVSASALSFRNEDMHYTKAICYHYYLLLLSLLSSKLIVSFFFLFLCCM